VEQLVRIDTGRLATPAYEFDEPIVRVRAAQQVDRLAVEDTLCDFRAVDGAQIIAKARKDEPVNGPPPDPCPRPGGGLDNRAYSAARRSGMTGKDDRAKLEEAIGRYNDAWNRQDLETIVAMHAPDFVFENHTAGERAEGEEAREHIAQILRNWPDLRFRARRIYVRDGLVVNEWTATATKDGKRLEWDGIDVFPFEGGLIKRKDVYSASHRPRVV
jgi:ketosteroid isomerase-like protein